LLFYDFDAQAFLASARDVEGLEFAAFDALPHGLTGHSEAAHGLIHRQISWRSVFGEASAQFVGD
jgi:hypothetical protein